MNAEREEDMKRGSAVMATYQAAMGGSDKAEAVHVRPCSHEVF